jgi:hypothetical protein
MFKARLVDEKVSEKRTGCLGDLVLGGGILLKWIILKWNIRLWRGFIWLRIGTPGGLLRTE